jgi:hypothetical protein
LAIANWQFKFCNLKFSISLPPLASVLTLPLHPPRFEPRAALGGGGAAGADLGIALGFFAVLAGGFVDPPLVALGQPPGSCDFPLGRADDFDAA